MDAPLVIEPGSNADFEWAAQLMATSEPWTRLRRGIEQCRAVFDSAEHQTFVAREADRRVGFLVLRLRGVVNSPYIPSIGVAADARGRGVGSALLRFVEQQVPADARDMFLCVSAFNTRARVLYERHGYRAVAELHDYIIPGSTEILMRKRLRSSD